MIPYLMFFCITGIPAIFFGPRRNNKPLWWLVWLIFVLFIGLRHHVGGDWDGYIIITQRIFSSTLTDASQDQEFLFSILSWITSHLGFGVYGANLVGAVVFCLGLFVFCAKLPNRWLALAAATPFLVIVAVMSANRQGIAIGIVLLVMARWSELSVRWRALGILVAALFHSSAGFLLVFSVLDLRISKAKKMLLMLIVAASSLWLVSRSELSWDRYTGIYLHHVEGVDAPGALAHLLLNLIPALLILLFKRKWSQVVPNFPLVINLCWMAIVLLVMLPFSTVAVSRMSLYLFPISISFLSGLPQFIRSPPAKALVQTFTVFILAGMLWFWLAYANTAFTYLPYQNLLSVDNNELVFPR